jgi:hypothetical protein
LRAAINTVHFVLTDLTSPDCRPVGDFSLRRASARLQPGFSPTSGRSCETHGRRAEVRAPLGTAEAFPRAEGCPT